MEAVAEKVNQLNLYKVVFLTLGRLSGNVSWISTG